jgi:predicted nuclease of predicted toxin-antitoxin system
MLSLLLDQGLPRSTTAILAERGFVISHVGELGMAKATDQQIIDFAREQGSVVITLDADFHSLLAVSEEQSPSVVRIRIEHLKGPDVAQIIEQVLAHAESDLESGALVTVNEKSIRVHQLPISRKSSD